MANPDITGEAIVSADADGQGYIRADGRYLAQALKACGGMADISLTNALSPILFSTDGYRLVVMPMLTEKAQAEAKAKAETPTEPAEKPKRKQKAKEPAAVA
jgi:DNA polymerase-3 subunit beta